MQEHKTSMYLDRDKKHHPFERLIQEVFGQDRPIVWSFFCDVEKLWANKRVPTIASSQKIAILQNLDEAAFWLARPQDYVVTLQAPSRDFLDQIPGLRISESHILVARPQSDSTHKTLPEILSEDLTLQSRIRKMVEKQGPIGYIPFGVTNFDEDFARASHLTVVGCSSKVAAYVNSKLFSRALCNATQEFPSIPGGVYTASNDILMEFDRIIRCAKKPTSVVVKDPNGVSGKGLRVFDNREELEAWLAFTKKHAGLPSHLIVEEWIRVKACFNHAFILYPNGSFDRLTLKESFLDRGRHRAHLDPPDFSPETIQTIHRCQKVVADQLHNNGYYGVVGVDGVIGCDGVTYPLVEINARLNWSTAQSNIKKHLPPNAVLKVLDFPFLSKKLVTTRALLALLRTRYVNKEHQSGMCLQLERPLGINFRNGVLNEGNLFAILYGPDREHIAQIERCVQETVHQIDRYLEEHSC